MILVNFKDGKSLQLDPTKRRDLESLDSVVVQSQISRVSILSEGFRVDLPTMAKGYTRVWLELLKKDGVLKGERVCLRLENQVIKATLYYSESRVVVDIFQFFLLYFCVIVDLMDRTNIPDNNTELLRKLYKLVEDIYERQQDLIIEVKLLRESTEKQRNRICDIEDHCARRPSICADKTPFPKLVIGNCDE